MLQKALMYVFAKHCRNIVSVDVGSECFYVRCEYHDGAGLGKYYIIEYPYNSLNGIDKEIKSALKELKWIADGNEFPE